MKVAERGGLPGGWSADLDPGGPARRSPLAILLLAGMVAACGGLQVEGNEPGKFTGSAPQDGAIDVDVDDPLIFIFNEAVATSKVTAQAATGPCEAVSVQVSADDFVTCVGGTVSFPENADHHKLQYQPSTPWTVSTKYVARVVKGLDFEAFLPLESDAAFTFTTAATPSDVAAPDSADPDDADGAGGGADLH